MKKNRSSRSRFITHRCFWAMNFPPLRKLLWKIHFMLVYSSKTLDWTCCKTGDLAEGMWEITRHGKASWHPWELCGLPTLGLPVFLDCDLLPAEGEFWLFLCPVTERGRSQHTHHVPWHTEECLLGWGGLWMSWLQGSALTSMWEEVLGGFLVTIKCLWKPQLGFLLLQGSACIITLLLLKLLLSLMW